MKTRIIVMSMLGVLSLFSCATGGNKDARITQFSYHYDGTIGGDSHRYDLKVSDGKATITVEEMMYREYGDMTDTADEAFIKALEELCVRHNVRKYDGFDKVNRHVCDGSGFSLYIKYDDGSSVNAHGMNSSPKGYREFADEMHELFRPYCERMRAAALQRLIEQGVTGELTFMMMNFIQQGKSGSDRYEMMISRGAIRKPNFELKIHSCSGEFFPQGEYTYYTDLPDDAIDWKAFTGLVRKHELVKWMNYHQSAKDYNNCEWFQMALDFEQGHISARGTEHPEHYDAFRKDFLTLLRKTIEDNSERLGE